MEADIAQKVDSFFRQFKHQLFKKGEVLIRADDEPSGIFYLQGGHVKKYAISEKGDEVVVNIFKPISFFPMSWAINNTHNTYFYEAITIVEVWRAPKEDSIEFLKQNSDVLYNLLSRVYKGTDGLETRMTYLMLGSAYDRLISELLISARRFGDKVESGRSIRIKISEKDLATQSGMTRETVSRELKILKEKKFLTFNKGELIILDLEELEQQLF